MNKIRRKRKKRNTNTKIRWLIYVLAALFIITLAGFSVFLFYSYRQEKSKTIQAMSEIEELKESNDALYSREEVEQMIEEEMQGMLDTIQTMMENGDGLLSLLQYCYPNHVVVSGDSGYHFFPILDSLEKNNFILENFTYPDEEEEDEWEVSYVAGDGVKARPGIDVSTFQGEINWNKVKNSGMEYAIIRLGFRGYETGKIVLDSRYQENIEGSLAAGLDTGVYFFTEALTEAEAVEEADFVIENLEGYDINMPVVIDVEKSADTEATRTKELTAKQRTKNVIAFCNRIEEAGYETMIYGNLYSFMIMLEIDQLEDYDKWFAYYRNPFHFPYKVRIWQYASWGEVDGIEGDADVNLMFY